MIDSIHIVAADMIICMHISRISITGDSHPPSMINISLVGQVCKGKLRLS